MDGATPNERLLAAARNDDEEGYSSAIANKADINCQDGAGDTPLHLAVKHGCIDVLEHILAHDECDVDPVNPMTGKTPLHYAIDLEDEDVRRAAVQSLFDAGADTSIKDKNGNTVQDLIASGQDEELRRLLRKSKAKESISANDIASDDDDADYSGTDSGSGVE